MNGWRGHHVLVNMTWEIIERLEGIGFIWSARGNHWDIQFQELRNLLAKHGHCNATRKTIDLLCGLKRSVKSIICYWMENHNQ